MSFEEFLDLNSTASYYGGKEQIAPEDEFFHNIYIAGTTRKNHIGVEEYAGKLQIRGVQYNVDKVYMIITHVKEVLVKSVQKQGRESMECFSYKEPPNGPWFGTSKLPDGSPRPCGTTSAERAVVEYCSPCRTHIIVAGILCNADGEPILQTRDDDKQQPIFVFIRGKGVKFPNVSNYLSQLSREDFSPLFTPPTEESLQFEKKVVNNKRVVTIVTIGKASTKYGDKQVFELNRGKEIPKESVIQVLNISKKILPKFNEKFDWSKSKVLKPNANPVVLDTPSSPPKEKMDSELKQPSTKKFSFDDIKF